MYRQLGASSADLAQPAAPEPFRLALDEGSIYVSGNKIAVVPALLSALVVKVVLFGGKKVGKAVRGSIGRKKATA